MRRPLFAALLVLAACEGNQGGPPPPKTAPASAHPAPPPQRMRMSNVQAPDASVPATGTLLLAIVATHAHEQPTPAAPWHAAGGDWTYLDLKTPAGATFTVGYHDAGAPRLDVRVIELDRAQGGAMVHELEQALGVTVSSAAVAAQALTPLTVAATIDADDPHGGDWTASTWSFAGASLHFDWSLGSNQAVLREADPAADGNAIAALGRALRDGLGPQP